MDHLLAEGGVQTTLQNKKTNKKPKKTKNIALQHPTTVSGWWVMFPAICVLPVIAKLLFVEYKLYIKHAAK